MPKLIDLTGQRFGRLIVLRRAEKNLTIKDLLLESSNLILKGDDYYFSQHKTSTNNN